MQDWRKSKEYRIWRAQVIRRDTKCVVCGTLKNHQAHHINHSRYFPELRFNPENGVVLCEVCHRQFHNNFKSSSREKCNDKDFSNFMALVAYLKGLV